MSAPLSRRRFLSAAAGTVAAPLVGAHVHAAAAQDTAAPERPRAPAGSLAVRLAVKLGMVQEPLPLADKFRLLRDLGFEGVELDSPNAFETKDVLAARDASGIVIHGVVDAVHWRDTLSDPDAAVRAKGLAALRTALGDAKDYGASTCLLVPGVVRKHIRYDHVYVRSQAEIRKALPQAAELGVAIAIENVWNGFLLSPVEAARYLDELASPHVGMYFDVGNVVRYGYPEHWIHALGHRILKLDVKEYSKDKGFGVRLLEGDCDWPSVVAALRAIGYSGWATAEMRGGDRKWLASIKERMSQIFSL